MSKAAKCGYKITLDDSSAVISNSSGTIIISARLCKSLYVYESEKTQLHSMRANDVNDECVKWHERYDHLNMKSLKCLSQNNLVRGIEIQDFPNTVSCDTCFKGKICVLPFPRNNNIRSSSVLELVHSDICGPMRTTSLGGYKYFALFIDDFSRMIFVCF